jgi:hypothetical protein
MLQFSELDARRGELNKLCYSMMTNEGIPVPLQTSLRTNVSEEFKRSPISVSATVGGVIIAVIGLLVAAPGQPTKHAVSGAPTSAGDVDSFILRNFLFVLSFFLAATVSSATLIRLLARTRSWGAVVLSVPTAATSSFLTLAIWRIWPPRTLTLETLPDARNLVFSATIIVYVALTGSAVLRDIARTTPAAKSTDVAVPSEGEASQGLDILFLTGFFLFVWAIATAACLQRLVELFLL